MFQAVTISIMMVVRVMAMKTTSIKRISAPWTDQWNKFPLPKRTLEKWGSWTRGILHLEYKGAIGCWVLLFGLETGQSEEAQTLKVLALYPPFSDQNALTYLYTALLLTAICLGFTERKAGGFSLRGRNSTPRIRHSCQYRWAAHQHSPTSLWADIQPDPGKALRFSSRSLVF